MARQTIQRANGDNLDGLLDEARTQKNRLYPWSTPIRWRSFSALLGLYVSGAVSERIYDR